MQTKFGQSDDLDLLGVPPKHSAHNEKPLLLPEVAGFWGRFSE